MKIQAVRNNTTTSNYQADRTKQQSFGEVRLDKRGLLLLPKRVRLPILSAYARVHRELGELMSAKDIDVLVHPVKRKSAPAGVVILRPLRSGGIKSVFKSINEPGFASSLAQDIKAALTKKSPAYGTFAEAASKKPQPAHLWDIKAQLPKPELKARFAEHA